MIRFYWSWLKQTLSKLVTETEELDTDVQKIRHVSPYFKVILSCDVPVKVSPGVYIFRGHPIGDLRERRYRGWCLGDECKIELWK